MPSALAHELPTGDRLALVALEGALLDARAGQEGRPALAIIADAVADLGIRARPGRASELLAIDWRDLLLDDERPVGLVRRGKGQRPRPQPLPALLADKLRQLRADLRPDPIDPVFRRREGGRLQACILASIIRRCTRRAGIDRHVTAHTLRHTAAT